MPSPIDNLLFQLRAAIKAEVRDEVRKELIADLGGGRPSKRVVKKAVALKSGGRRSSDDIEQAGRVIQIWLRNHPGSRVEQMAEGLGVDTKALMRPILKLLADKKLTKKGVKRGTTYTARG